MSRSVKEREGEEMEARNVMTTPEVAVHSDTRIEDATIEETDHADL